MVVALEQLQHKLEEVIHRLDHLEERFQAAAEVPPWRYLVARPHLWRRQLCVKGRNLTVGQLVSTLRANRLAPEAAAEDLELPLEAIHEALSYYEANRALIQLEANEERRWLAEQGHALEPKTLPG